MIKQMLLKPKNNILLAKNFMFFSWPFFWRSVWFIEKKILILNPSTLYLTKNM